MLEKHHVWFRAPGSVAGNVLKSHQNDAVLNMAGEVQNMWHVVLLPQTWLETTWCSTMTVLLHRWRSGLTYFLYTQVNVSLLSSCSSSLHTHSFLSVCLCDESEAVSLFNFTSETCLFRRPHLHLPPPSAAADCCRLRLASTAQDAHTLMWEHTRTHECVCVCLVLHRATGLYLWSINIWTVERRFMLIVALFRFQLWYGSKMFPWWSDRLTEDQ